MSGSMFESSGGVSFKLAPDLFGVTSADLPRSTPASSLRLRHYMREARESSALVL